MPLKKDEKTQFSKYRTLKIEHMKPHEKFGVRSGFEAE